MARALSCGSAAAAPRELPRSPPATPTIAIAELVRRWPEYVKGMSAMRLAEWLSEREVRQALQVEAELACFLYDIGFR
jgi:hypothetical protein